MLKIVTAPHPVLNQPTKKVTKIDKKIKKLVYLMEKTLEAQTDPPGVGLAANQVGYSLSLFIAKPTKKSKIKVFINPKIKKTIAQNTIKTKKNKKKDLALEGCLSIPKIWGPVKRAKKVLVEYQDLEGKIKTEWFNGIEATIIQHEMDHLQGKLFTQRAIEQNQPLYREEDNELEKINN